MKVSMQRDVDIILERLRSEYPEITVEQLKVKFPDADDDGIWFIRHPRTPFEVQIESTEGMCPFLIETDEHDQRKEGRSVDEVVDDVKQWLHLS